MVNTRNKNELVSPAKYSTSPSRMNVSIYVTTDSVIMA